MAKKDVEETKATGKGEVDPMAKRPDHIGQEDFNLPVDDDTRFPRLKLIQALSPEKDRTNVEKYIKGIEEGNLLLQSDTMQRIIDGDIGIVVIPLAIRKRYAEYIPRDAGGGFVASYNTKEEMEEGSTPGNDIQVTVEFLCIEGDIPTEEATPFLITMDSVTKLGVAKKWAGYINQYKTIDGVKYRVTGKAAKNKKQQVYYNFNVVPVGWVEKKQYALVHAMTEENAPLFLPETTDSEI